MSGVQQTNGRTARVRRVRPDEVVPPTGRRDLEQEERAVADPVVSIIIVAFQALEDLRECLPSLSRSRTVPQEVILVENASTDGTVDFVRRAHPEVTLIRNEENRGFAMPCNRGAAAARGDVLIFLNSDTIVTPGWVDPLVAELRDPSVGACMPRILLHGMSQVNTMGLRVHWSGLAWMDRWQAQDPGPGPAEEVFGASGCALAIRADTFREVQGFTEDFFIYHDDVDLCWRLRLRGYRAMAVPKASIQHKYSFSHNPLKWQLAERNRLKMILANYHWATLVLLSPALIAVEVGLWLYAARAGLLRGKWRGTCDLARGLPRLLRRRKIVQASRRVSDWQIWRKLSSSRELWRASHQYAAAGQQEGQVR